MSFWEWLAGIVGLLAGVTVLFWHGVTPKRPAPVIRVKAPFRFWTFAFQVVVFVVVAYGTSFIAPPGSGVPILAGAAFAYVATDLAGRVAGPAKRGERSSLESPAEPELLPPEPKDRTPRRG